MHRNDIARRIERFDFRAKVALLAVSIAIIAVLAAAAYRENFRPEWRRHQLAYRAILEEKAGDEAGRKLARDFQIELRQLVVPELGAVDRCVTCHTGFDDPRMADQPQPFRTHPGSYLAHHDVARFGCTSCHLGQGRATEAAAAHGDDPHWDRPMIEKEFLGAACSRCHAEGDLYAAPVDVPGGDLIALGKSLVREKGCLGCHAYRGKGGTIGPDLTYVGDKSRHDFGFSRFEKGEPREVRYWLRKHFLEPQKISPGSVMPPMDLGEREIDALTAYMMSLKRRDSPSGYRPAPEVREVRADAPASGERLYSLFCSSCHGRDGRGSEVPELRTPALNNADFLAAAGDDYLRRIIAWGRSGTAMPAWATDGGLAREEIDRLVALIRAWEPEAPDLRGVASGKGSPARGRVLYEGNCAGCHGIRGEGGIGNTLDSPTFLAVASDTFLARSIVWGRPGTAMPSWRSLEAGDVSDLLAYIRSWQGREPDSETIVRLSTELPDREPLGESTYRAHCAACHGAEGEGGIGVALASEDFLSRVSRRYLADALLTGRPGTAMPSWKHLGDEQLAALVSHLKSRQRGPDIETAEPVRRGNWQLGEVVYREACSGCHGAAGEGGSGPQIANPAFLASATDAMLFAWIGYGKSGTAMKGFLPEAQGVLSLREDRIHDVIAYLRRLGLAEDLPLARSGVGDATVGEELYRGNCASCHGLYGEGASGPQLNNRAFLDSASDGFLAATIVLGRTNTPMRSMVHGQERLAQLRPGEVDDIIAYLRLWSEPATWRLPRPAVEMTEEAIGSGRRAYGQFCAGCHGPEGRGVAEGADYFAPALNNPEFLRAASDGFLLATIARGRRDTPMRPFGKGAGGIAELSGTVIQDIVSYIRSWTEPAPDAAPLVAEYHTETGVLEE